jgi:hypothetical protein
MWKIKDIVAGGIWDGRVSGKAPAPSPRYTPSAPEKCAIHSAMSLVEKGAQLPLTAWDDDGDDDDDDADDYVYDPSTCLACDSLYLKWQGEAAVDRPDLYARNVIRPLNLQGPPSAYAVVTPDGIWHECVEPEEQDVVASNLPPGEWHQVALRAKKLTKLQVAWRLEVAEFLMRYQHCWLLGADAELAPSPAMACAQGYFRKQGSTWLVSDGSESD